MKLARLVAVILVALLTGQPGMSVTVKSQAKSTGLVHVRLVDVNHASLDQLKSLPGIQEALAAKIVKNRPYANKAQLSSKGVISAATYKRIRSRIIAKQ
jgi:DNA uptake protein ComE-like DNA-binding protein